MQTPGGASASNSTSAKSGRYPRVRLRVRGAVQGVGFRPVAYRVARRLSLGGFVRNDPDGVLIEVEGVQAEAFADLLRAEAPPLARIDAIEQERMAATGDADFTIANSVAGGDLRTRIPADVATCEACLDDLFDPASRYHGYPFVNCTHCGPRYTLTYALPYDRGQTSMADFAMCEDCLAEYRDPSSRRFHAEPIACPRCGPRLTHSVAEIVAQLRAGRIVALKGVGGYHLMCDARNEAAVARLRSAKRRNAKPFALMVANGPSLRLIAEPTEQEVRMAAAPSRPVVLMRSRGALPEAIAPGLTRIGAMLAYTPLHHLIFAAAAPDQPRDAPVDFILVATSANLSDEPLITQDEEARTKLRGLADIVVAHDRRIVARADDSVVQEIDGAPAFIRRARGFTPEPIDLGRDGPCVLACGGHLKAAVTITRGREAFVAQHVGDLSSAEAQRFYRETIEHLTGLLGVRPDAVACDMHPDYLSTRYAGETGLPMVPVQHHVAHVAAIAAEHGLIGPVYGAALDGHGYGLEGAAWGGELLRVDGAAWTRPGRLAPLMMIGAERAAREPWRMAIAACLAAGRPGAAARFAAGPQGVAILEIVHRRAWPHTSSLGRLFDAAAGLLLSDARQDYEGHAAMRLEALVDTPRVLKGGWRLADGVLDFAPLLAGLIDETPDPRAGAELFHGTVAAGLVDWIAADPGVAAGAKVALGGGCMTNRVLAEGVARGLRARGLAPLHARAVPPGDGGLSLGQAAVARAVLEES